MGPEPEYSYEQYSYKEKRVHFDAFEDMTSSNLYIESHMSQRLVLSIILKTFINNGFPGNCCTFFKILEVTMVVSLFQDFS